MKSRILNHVNFEHANALLEGFNKATGFVTAILDLDGKILSKSGWRQICTDFHRLNFETALNCTVSDTELASKLGEGEKYHFYKCINGLIDVAVPIIIKEEHIANLFSGQFFFEEPDVSFFKKQAQRYGFDERTYLEALEKVPVLSKEKVESAMEFLLNITQTIIEMTAEKLDQIDLNEEIRKREAALLESQVQLKQKANDLLESQQIAHVGTWILNLATNQVVWSEELYKMYGFDPAFPPPPYTEHMKLFTSESWFRLSTALECTKTSGIPYELELETVTIDGSNGWMWVRGEAKTDPSGNIVSLWGAAQDITERKNAEVALKENEEKYRLLYTSMSQGLALHEIETDDEGKPVDYIFLDINESYTHLLGITREMCIGKRITEVMPKVEQYWIDIFGKVALTGEPMYYENYLETTGGYYATYTYSPRKRQFAVLVTDVTERKKNEEKLKHLSYHDQLTELYNRRFFEEELSRLDIKRNLPMSIIMADINGLKIINDSFGHNVGDEYLIKVAEILKNACRADEIIARLGGDEFGIILTKTDTVEAAKIVKRFKDLIFEAKVGGLVLSVSFGYDTKENEEQLISEIIASAENHMYTHKIVERSSMRSKTVEMIMSALFEKSNREAQHSQRVSEICEVIATKMHFDIDDVEQIKIAGLVHDIGKIGIEEGVLNKTGYLATDEWKMIKKHPEAGWRILNTTIEFSETARLVLHHHERFDGKGYPNGLKGEEIPIQARIIAIADAYDAMTSERSYRKAISHEEAIEEIKRCSGTHFDPAIVDVFVR